MTPGIKSFKKVSSSNILISLLYFVASLLLSIYLRADNAASDGFSAELGNVAASLASGSGFSNVFEVNSGYTAWCPPLYVLTYAIIFLIFGVKTVSAFWALIVLRAFLLALTLYWLMEIDYSEKINKYKILLLPIFAGYTFLVIYRTGPRDAMFAVFLSVLVLYIIQKVQKTGFKRNWPQAYILAFTLPFANISLSIGLISFIILGHYKKIPGLNWKHAISLIMLIMFSFSIWGFRNQTMLGKFIPFKSNLWFELFISNVNDDDGLLKYSNYRVYHPFINKSVRDDYIKKGEVKFLDQYKSESVNYLKNKPLRFLRNIANRFFNIFIYAESEYDIELADVGKIGVEDLKKLTTNGLILDNYWICLEQPPEEIDGILADMDLAGDKSIIFEDWKAKASISSSRIQNTGDIVEFLKGIIISVLPSFAIIICLFKFSIRRNHVFFVTMILFLLSIGPYLMISWLPRYQSFQLGFFTVFVFMAAATLIDYLNDRSGYFSGFFD